MATVGSTSAARCWDEGSLSYSVAFGERATFELPEVEPRIHSSVLAVALNPVIDCGLDCSYNGVAYVNEIDSIITIYS